MSVQITVTLSDAQYKALAHVAVSPKDWIENFVYARCESATDEIVSAVVERKLKTGEPISGTKETIVLEADIDSAAERETKIKKPF